MSCDDDYDLECKRCEYRFYSLDIFCGHLIKPDHCPACDAPENEMREVIDIPEESQNED